MSELQEIRQIIEDKLTGIHAEIRASNDFMNEQNKHIKSELNEIKKRQDIANGRTSKLEERTKAARFLERHPVVCIVLFTGLVVLSDYIDIESIINYLIQTLV